ncbi:leucine-rich repeat extensin-like protein 4 [Canna indica]|uniref:Leucine-rich repeat extensin-like protein 4 n=1 Tax=Canna indica TaxID=4628 RepID=A0AAQ3Q2S0_9LILI|nr:leucine-rich repeat extensin-like protein 4 [Canna indica]
MENSELKNELKVETSGSKKSDGGHGGFTEEQYSTLLNLLGNKNNFSMVNMVARSQQQTLHREVHRRGAPLSHLHYHYLHFNEFEGPIPSALFEWLLDAIFLNTNRLRGSISTTIGESLVSVLVLANNDLDGCISSSIGGMTGMLNKIILLDDNLTCCNNDLVDVEGVALKRPPEGVDVIVRDKLEEA